jgi:hypothetical protein
MHQALLLSSMEVDALFLRYGLKINLRKSHILGPKVQETPNAPQCKYTRTSFRRD